MRRRPPFFSFARVRQILRRLLPGSDLARVTPSNPGLLLKVDPEGGILFANPEVERILYGMGLPPQHAELLLPDDAGAIVRDILSSEEKVRTLTCKAEGRTIQYTLYGFEKDDTVLFHGVDVTGERGREEEPRRSRGIETGTVLLVDDEELVRDVVAAMLASLGFDVLTASNGREGVEIFRREHARISFIILDLRMPVMDGTRAFEEIRKIDPAARIVISAGFGGDEDVDRLKEQGAADALLKPYTYREIARVVGLFRNPLSLPVQE